MPVAVITGASRGLGRALAIELARQQWTLVLDARGADDLSTVQAELPGGQHHAFAGDVADPAHRTKLVAAARSAGGASLLVNNASTLGASPLPAFADLDPATYLEILRVNLVAPMALAAALLPSSGAAGAGSSTSPPTRRSSPTRAGAATARPRLRSTTPGGCWPPRNRTYGSTRSIRRHAHRMHQDAFPGEDISDRPGPETVVPAVLALLAADLPSGRYVAGDLHRAAA